MRSLHPHPHSSTAQTQKVGVYFELLEKYITFGNANP